MNQNDKAHFTTLRWVSLAGITLALVTTVALSGLGAAMEDAAIHLALAKDFASDGFFSLTRGIPAGAVTSPLWVFSEAILLALTNSIPLTLTIMSLLSLVVFGFNAIRLLSRTNPSLAWMTVLLVLTLGPVQWHIWSGMETFLFAGFILGALAALDREEFMHSGLWTSAAILTRMEGVLLVGLLILWGWYRTRKESKWPRGLEKGILIGVLSFGLFSLINLFHTGHFMPTTGAGKRFLYGVHWHGIDAIPILPTRLYTLSSDWAAFLHGALAKNGLEPLFWLSVLMAPLGVYALWKEKNRGAALLIVWAALITTVYALELPVRDVGGRYQALNLVLLPLFSASAIVWLVQKRALIGFGLLALLLIQQGATVLTWSEARAMQIEHLETVHHSAGKWIQENNPECLPIVLGEIGWISYWSKEETCSPPIRDYYALADPGYFAEASRGKAFSAAIPPGKKAIFALSMLSTNLPSIHLRLQFPEGEPGTWSPGKSYLVVEEVTQKSFRFTLEKIFAYTFPEKPGYLHPAGRITGMNPILVGKVVALP